MLRPAAIVLVNNDLTPSTVRALVSQLFIDEVIDGYVFDDRVIADSSYPTTIRQLNMRLMVVRHFNEDFDRTNYDVVIFVSHALAAIEKNKFGPPGLTHSVDRLTWPKLMVYETNL